MICKVHPLWSVRWGVKNVPSIAMFICIMITISWLYLSLVFRKLHVNLRDNSTTTNSGQQQRYGRRLLRSNIGWAGAGRHWKPALRAERAEQRRQWELRDRQEGSWTLRAAILKWSFRKHERGNLQFYHYHQIINLVFIRSVGLLEQKRWGIYIFLQYNLQ